ncbi:hypothetical protein PSPO_b0383 [Pseudoalteromonas spongiae UST010723-006]|nr:hypothetical protein PSPO_b0383 [Pseudoalteromonas spongiae UST010723-006]
MWLSVFIDVSTQKRRLSAFYFYILRNLRFGLEVLFAMRRYRVCVTA